MRLLVLCQDPAGPVVRHRVRAVLPHLAEAGFDDVDVRAIPKRLRERLALFRGAACADAVLLVRKLLIRAQLSWLAKHARRLAFDCDDAVMYRDPFRGRPRSHVRAARFRAAVRHADLVLAGNAYLAGLAAEHAPGSVRVALAPTPVDTARYVPASPGARGADGVRRIGWIGARATRPYLRLVAAPLARLLAEHRGVRFCVMADAPPDLPFDVEFTRWSEGAEVAWLQSLAIGIMPLSDDPWSRGKCGFKLLQYMACGVPAVASAVGANVDVADDGAAALLADGDGAWFEALSRLLDDGTFARTLAERGRARAESRYCVAVLGPRYASALAACARSARR